MAMFFLSPCVSSSFSLAVSKGKSGCIAIKTSPENETVDGFFDYYKPYQLTNMEELYCFGMTHSIRYNMSHLDIWFVRGVHVYGALVHLIGLKHWF